MRQSSPSTSRHQPRIASVRNRQLRGRPSPAPDCQPPAVWKSPLLWLAVPAILTVGAIPVIDWYRTGRVIAILASDVSDSGLADPAVGQAICRAQTQALKSEDVAIDISYADTTEATRSGTVRSVTQMFPRCQDDTKQRPTTLGKGIGTSPVLVMERIQTQVQIHRKDSNSNPIAAVVWMQAAEPGPGLPPLDFDALGQQIKQITDDRGQLTIIGPTGQLRQNLEQLSAQNPRLKICSVAEHQSCIRETFAAARALPPGK